MVYISAFSYQKGNHGMVPELYSRTYNAGKGNGGMIGVQLLELLKIPKVLLQNCLQQMTSQQLVCFQRSDKKEKTNGRQYT